MNGMTFKVRRANNISGKLGMKAAPEGYNWMPVYSWLDKYNYEDKISGHACKYSYQSNLKRFENPNNSEWADANVFPDWMYLVDEMKASYKFELGLTPAQSNAMTFLDAYHYADVITSKKFEGNTLNL